MKPELKMEGDNLLVSFDLEKGIDADKDGVMSASVKGSIACKLDGSEVLDELVKNSSLVEKIKEKLGL